MKISADRLQVLLTVFCGGFLVLSFIALIPGYWGWHSDRWAILAVFCGSFFAIRSALESIRERNLDVNLLMVLAAAGAMAVGHIDDAAVLLFLFSLSSTLEALAMRRTQSAIEALVRLRPEEALRVGPNGDEKVRVEALEVGDTVRVLPFEPIPTDGELTSDQASLDEAAMTGESHPVERSRGDKLTAGTQNLDSMLTMRVTHAVSDSTLERIVQLVQEAQDNKASGERISKWFGERYTIFVICAFLISLVARLILQHPWQEAFYASLILLVALSPCALVISSPAAALSALAFAARKGVLVRGGQYVEESGRITTVALDKTGTLTQGRPQVVEICVGKSLVPAGACATGGGDADNIVCWHRHEDLHDEAKQALRLAASAEQFSTHPIAESIVNYARAAELVVPPADSHIAVAGMGVEAQVEGQTVRVGQLKFFANADLPTHFREHVEEMRSRGITAVLLQTEDSWAAIGLRDEARPEAKAFVQDLRRSGVHRVVMLTGDNQATAEAVAQEVGVDQVHAGLMPEDKQKLIASWVASGERVMMVGDGINDAPALTTAHLGVAMGGLGSEVALRSADVVLIQDRIERLPTLLRLGRLTNRVIRANLLFAAGVIVCLTVASFITTLPLPMAVIGHEGSTVLVILNGLRLLRGPAR